MAHNSVNEDFKLAYTARAANAKRHRKRRKRKQSFFNIFLLIVLCIAVVLLVFSTLFKVEEIIIEGECRYDKTKIISCSGIMYGERIYNIDKKKVIHSIETEFNYLENVEVKTDLFGTVIIVVNEIKSDFALKNGSTYILLSSALKITEMDVDILPPNIPIIEGIDAEYPEVNTQLMVSQNDAQKEEPLKDIIDCMRQSGLTGINKIDMSQVLDIKMEYDNRVIILLGTKNKMKSKIENIKYIIDNEVKDRNYYCIEAVFQESEVPRTSIRPIISLEDYYKGHETAASYTDESITQNNGIDGIDMESEAETSEDVATVNDTSSLEEE